MVLLDTGYNVARLAWLLRDLPVLLAARVRSNRVFHRPPPASVPGAGARRLKHGPGFRCDDPGTWHDPAVTRDAERPGGGEVQVAAWHRMHLMIVRRTGGFEDRPQGTGLAVIEGTLIWLTVPCRARPMWLWAAAPAAGEGLVKLVWTSYLRRSGLEHAFRFPRQQLGWTRPVLRDPAAAGRRAWLIVACYAQLWLARTLAAVTRLPWQRPSRLGPIYVSIVRLGCHLCPRALA